MLEVFVADARTDSIYVPVEIVEETSDSSNGVEAIATSDNVLLTGTPQVAEDDGPQGARESIKERVKRIFQGGFCRPLAVVLPLVAVVLRRKWPR